MLRVKVPPAFYQMLEAQVRNSGKKARGCRWTLEDKLLFIPMYQQSPRLYAYLRRLIKLPSPRSLKDQLGYMSYETEVNSSVMSLRKKAENLEGHEQECVMMMDEISFKKGLGYDAKNDQVVGFVDHGKEGTTDVVANHAMVLMIRGIYGDWKMPITYYLTSNGMTARDQIPLVRSVIQAVNEARFRVRALVCDAATRNTSMFNLLGVTVERPYFTVDGQRVCAIIYTQHLLKAVRNNPMKYDFHFGDKAARWKDIEDFVTIDSQFPARIAPKITTHLNPQQQEKMSVNLAAEVLSSRVAAGLYIYTDTGRLPPQAEGTAYMTLLLDKVFDSFNGTTAAVRGSPPPAKPYRMSVSKESPHLELWKEAVKWLEYLTFYNAETRQPVRNNGPTFHRSLLITMKAMDVLWQDLEGEGYQSLPTRRLNQDPLENLFSTIRYSVTYENHRLHPTAAEIIPALTSTLIGMVARTKGNCQLDADEILTDLQSLIVDQPDKDKGRERLSVYRINLFLPKNKVSKTSA